MQPETTANLALEAAMREVASDLESLLDRLLPLSEGPENRLIQAMRYSALEGGKRLRPFLVVETSHLFNVGRSCALRVAAAVEMIHCYSLIHDDLPAMDDSLLRRGRPTAHIAFDEATAILAGDALLTLAFEILADASTHNDPAVRIELVKALAEAAGAHGMCGGQMLDLVAEGETLDIGAITRLQRLKTGAIIAFSCIAGAILGKAAAPSRHSLQAYAHDLGLAFQVADDLLDAEGEASELGKDVRQDNVAGKATFVSILGIDRARAQMIMLADQASQHLEPFGDKADLLRAVTLFVITRRN